MKLFPTRMEVRRALALGATSAALLAACSAGPEAAEPADEPPSRVTQEQKKSFTPTSCSGDDGIPDSFWTECLLAGGSRVECSGGVAWCCEPCPELGPDCVEHCSQDPSDIRVAIEPDNGPIIDTVTDEPGRPRAPIDQPPIDEIAPVKTPSPPSPAPAPSVLK